MTGAGQIGMTIARRIGFGKKFIVELKNFIKECGLQSRLSQLRSKIEITDDALRKVADSINIIKTNPKQLDHEKIYQILCEDK